MRTGPEQRLKLTRLGGLARDRGADPLVRGTVRYAGSIESRCTRRSTARCRGRRSASEERIKLAWDLADVFAWQVDFSRDLQPGDQFQVVLERLMSEEGEARVGDVLAGDLR